MREASREVANFTERKNPHTPAYCVKELVCLSSVTKFDHNYLRTGKIEWAEIFFGTSMAKAMSQNFYLSKNWLAGLGPRAETATQTCTINRGLRNLPQKFHLFLIILSN